MTAAEIIPIACSLVSCVCAVFVAYRGQRWRETDDARALLGRVSDLESRVQAVEIRQEDLPTQADVEKLRGEVHALATQVTATGEQVKAAAAGINRIEGHFIQHSRIPG